MSKKKDDIKIEYSGLLSLITYEGQLIWSVFSKLLAVNSFLIAFNVAIIKLFGNYIFIAIGISVLGLIICGIWFNMTKRMFSYYDFRFACLRECEKQLFTDNNCYIEKGKVFARGDTVKIGEKPYSLKGLSRIITNQTMIYIIIFVILLLYITILFWGIFLMPCIASRTG
jgi:hypothetical protein